MTKYDQDIYRFTNKDIEHLGDEELYLHWLRNGKSERRLYSNVPTTHDRLSQRWLRGSGIEIGAGGSPTALYGDARAVYADSDPSFFYGGKGADYIFSLDDPAISKKIELNRFDFVIASHVLEHVDSFLIGVRNVVSLLKVDGVAYIALPCCDMDHDQKWMLKYDFEHHMAEVVNPQVYAKDHDAVFEKVLGKKLDSADRFKFHKHSYSFNDWSELFTRTRNYLLDSFKIVDCALGYERYDFNIVLQKT